MAKKQSKIRTTADGKYQIWNHEDGFSFLVSVKATAAKRANCIRGRSIGWNSRSVEYSLNKVCPERL